MAASAESCAHCGKQGVGFKHCSVCKHACYCGVACQNANWKRHKKTCAPPVPMQDVGAKILAAHATGDWRGVLQWEGRREELMARRPDDVCSATARQIDHAYSAILDAFSEAHQVGWQATGSNDHAHSCVGLQKRRIPILGKLQRFRDQGEASAPLPTSSCLCRGTAKP